MLKIGGNHVDKIIESINNQTIDGVTFVLVHSKGIQATFKHNASSDAEAKAVLKKFFSSNAEFEAYFISIQFC